DSADNRVLINEQAALALGLGSSHEAVGKNIYFNNGSPLIVQGVLKNFCYSNYQFDLQPILIQYNPALFKVISLQLSGSYDQDAMIVSMRKLWKTYHPYEDLSYSWYEKEMYDRYYPGADMRFLGMISGIILVIAVMGLLGMVIYTMEKRIREIGIRKVIGASVQAIVKELSGKFIKLLVIANLIAIPIGYISGRLLLTVFTFHNGVSIPLMIYIVLGVFFIALGTIVINSVKAASSNPVKSLRSE
ncbi:MAG: FtsX-like permease family protein, partial [Saprospiraceae bacterium]